MRSQPPWLKVGQPSRPPTQKEKAMPYCTVETENEAPIKIHYEDHGRGQPVVLLHGFPDSGRLWRHQVPALTGAGYRVIVPDMRGYGRSARPVEVDAYNILHLASDVRAVLADAGVPRAHVVGHDWGAAAAWALASVEPDTVDRLVAPVDRASGHVHGPPGSAGSRSAGEVVLQVAVREPMDQLPDPVPSPGRSRGDRRSRSEFHAHPRAQLLPGHRQ